MVWCAYMTVSEFQCFEGDGFGDVGGTVDSMILSEEMVLSG